MNKSIFTTTQQSANTSTASMGGLSKQSGETYASWGSRYAGATNADKEALRPALDQVILTNKQEQIGNETEQQNRKLAISADIETKKNNISAFEQQKNNLLDDKNGLNEQIIGKKNDIANIKEGNSHRGMAKVYFYIGTIVTLALAIYLFIFYSSAAFSAFFRDGTDDVGEAIFYPYAFQDALAMSLGNFLLILFLPMIFLALGVLLHKFSKGKGFGKYVKITLLYFITFCFDALLAFEISQKMFIPSPTEPVYTMEMAINSPNFWVIIFAGFIAYIIWGLVFDFTMESYEEMTNGSTTIKRFEQEIIALQNQIRQLDVKIGEKDTAITSLQNEIARLEHSLRSSTWYDITIIKNCLNEFFGGWLGYMTLVGKTESEKNEATAILNTRLTSLTQNSTYNEK